MLSEVERLSPEIAAILGQVDQHGEEVKRILLEKLKSDLPVLPGIVAGASNYYNLSGKGRTPEAQGIILVTERNLDDYDPHANYIVLNGSGIHRARLAINGGYWGKADYFNTQEISPREYLSFAPKALSEIERMVEHRRDYEARLSVRVDTTPGPLTTL